MTTTVISTTIGGVTIGHQFAADRDTLNLTGTGIIRARDTGVLSFFDRSTVNVLGAVTSSGGFGDRIDGNLGAVHVGFDARSP